MSEIFDLIVDPLGLPISAIWEWIILLIIGEIAYRLAYGVVGDVYGGGFISSSGAILHWIIRLVFFVMIWAATYVVIVGCKFVYANRKIILIIGGIALVILVIYLLIKHLKKNKPVEYIDDVAETEEAEK